MTEGVRDVGWIGEYLAGSRHFDTAVAVVQTASAQLARVNFRFPCLARGQGPEGSYVFALSRSRAEPSWIGGESLVNSAVGLIRPGAEYQFRTTASEELLLLAVSREWVDRETIACWGHSLGETGERTTFSFESPRLARRLSHGWSNLLEASFLQPGSVASGEAAHRLGQEFPVELLRAIAPPQPARSGSARRQVARRGEAYLRENLHHPLALSDLCREVGSNERTLREGFQELYGLSPISYLKALRLRTARARLRSAGSDVRISDIALDCGFKHLGRFSVSYRRIFGETPSETRRRPEAR